MPLKHNHSNNNGTYGHSDSDISELMWFIEVLGTQGHLLSKPNPLSNENVLSAIIRASAGRTLFPVEHGMERWGAFLGKLSDVSVSYTHLASYAPKYMSYCDMYKQLLIAHLLEDGYPDYAAILYHQKLCLTYWMSTAGINISGDTLVINPRIFVEPSAKENQCTLQSVLELSNLIVRHELLHRILKHSSRLQNLEKTLTESYNPDLGNIAADLEVSNYYSQKDADTWHKYSHVFYGGLTVYAEFRELYNNAQNAALSSFCKMKSCRSDLQNICMEDLYTILCEEMGNQDSLSESGQESCNAEQEPKSNISDALGGKEQNGEKKEDQGTQGNQTDIESDTDHGTESYDSTASDTLPKPVQKYDERLLDGVTQSSKEVRKPPITKLGKYIRPLQSETYSPCVESVESMEYTAGDSEELPHFDEEVYKHTLGYDLRLFFGEAGRYTQHRTYKRPNKKYSDSGDVVVKARVTSSKDPSTLAVYVDFSGSFDLAKTAAALAVFERMKHQRNLTLKEFAFSTRVVPLAEESSLGLDRCTRYRSVMEHIAQNKFSNVAIISDFDEVGPQKYISVPSCVSSIWSCTITSSSSVIIAPPLISWAHSQTRSRHVMMSLWLIRLLASEGAYSIPVAKFSSFGSSCNLDNLYAEAHKKVTYSPYEDCPVQIAGDFVERL